MAAVIGGEGLGVYNGTLTQLNGFGADGRSRVGFGRDNAFVNAANGNLVLRGQDEFVASQGPDLEFFRTYNSQGPSIDRNGDNWQQSYARRIARSDDGSSLVRITGDGHQTLFSQVGSNNEWVSTDGAGAHDRIELQEDGSFTVEFGGTGLVETYSSNGRLLSIANADGHTVTLGYDITPPLISPLIEAGGGGGLLGGLLGGVVELVLDLVGAVLNLPLVSDLTGGVLGDLNPIEGASRLTTITDSNGQEIRLTYDGITEQLTQVSTFQYAAGADAESDQKVEVSRVSYEYEAYNADGLPGNEAQRLKTVGVALDPASSNSTNYATTYYYYPDSNRIGGAVQSDGSGFGISYIQVAGEYRVATFSDALGNVSHFSYALTPASYTVEGQVLSNVTRTTVMDPRKVKTHYYFDADQQLLAVETLAGPDHSQVQFFEYDDDGNVTAVTDEAGRRTEHLYDDQGNVIRSRDELGNTLVRGYDPSTQRLISETTYTDRDPDGIGQSGEPSEAQTRHFVYDDEQHLRFVIEADGGVTEHRYAPDGSAKDGQRTTTIAYVGIAYGGVTFGESALDAWVSGLPAAERAASQRTDFAYDPTGQLANVTRYAAVDGSTGDGINDGDASQTHYVYDAQGRLLMQVDPRRVAGDDGLTPVDRTDYASLSAAPDNLPSHVSLYVYNNLDLLTASTDAQGRTTQTSYSFAGPSGTTVTSTNAQGLETTTVYSRAGELLSQTLSGDGVQETTSYTYDAASNRLSQTNELGATQRFAYDASGNLVAQSSAEGELQLFDYNDAGNVIRKHERSDSLIHDVNLSDGEGFRPGSSFVGQDQVADRLFVDNDQLVIRNRSKSGSGSIFPSLIAQQEYSYQEGLVFRSEITTEGSNAERSAFIFVSNTDVIPGETDQVRRHGVQFRPNGELWANYFDPPTNNYKSVSIGTTKATPLM